MSTPNHEYHGLKASTWDLSRADTSNWSDKFFYLDMIRRFGEPVLDVGCGTGRIILDFLAQGIDIDGVDNSPDMLKICRQKAQQLGLSPALYQQSMEMLDLPRKYRTILVPSSTFTLIVDEAVAKEAMRRFFAHLQAGGGFVTAMGPCGFCDDAPSNSGWKLSCEKVRPEDGAIVRIWSHDWQELDKQLFHSEQRFEVELNGKIIDTQLVRRSPEGRCYTQAQAKQLFRDAGFDTVELYLAFTHQPAREDEKLFCAVGVKT